MSSAQSFRDLLVWQRAMEFAVEVYRVAGLFPARERFALTAQLTRAAASVAANIAEGNGRGTRKDYASFLAIAKGSLAEAETYLLLATRLGYIDESTSAPSLGLATEVSKMLTALRTRLISP